MPMGFSDSKLLTQISFQRRSHVVSLCGGTSLSTCALERDSGISATPSCGCSWRYRSANHFPRILRTVTHLYIYILPIWIAICSITTTIIYRKLSTHRTIRSALHIVSTATVLFYRWRKKGSAKVNNLMKVEQLVWGRTQNHSVHLCSLHLQPQICALDTLINSHQFWFAI